MKINSISRLTAAFFLIVLIASCNYEDGPVISFRTPKTRVVNKWEYHEVTKNGLDVTVQYTNAYADFKKNGNVIFYFSPDSINYGSWELSDDMKMIYIDVTDQNGYDTWWEDYNITKLKDNEMWIDGDVNGFTVKMQLKEY